MNNFTIEAWSNTIALTATAILVYLLIKYQIFKFFETWVQKTQFSFDTELVLALKGPVSLIPFCIIIVSAIANIPGIEHSHLLFFDNVLSSLTDIVVLYALYQLLKNDSTLFKSITRLLRLEKDVTLTHLLSNLIKFAIVTTGILLSAEHWDYNITGVLAGIGIGGIAIALAAQETLSNIIGGAALVVDNPFDNGDWIQTADVEGIVESSSFRSTRIRTFTQGLVTIPHANLAKSAITNWSRMEKRRVRFTLGVTYSTTAEQLELCLERIENILLMNKNIDHDNYLVAFDNYGANSLDILISYFILFTDNKEYFKLKSDINFKILNMLAQENISVAFPSRSIYFENPVPEENNVSMIKS